MPWLQSVSTHSVLVAWPKVKSAQRYEVFRSGKRIGTVSGNRVRIRGLSPATWYTIQVRAVRGTKRSAASDPLPVVTAAPTRCTHYVSASGSDHAAGTKQAPWRSVQRLVNSWQPGWVGCISGKYTGDITIARGGTKASPVVIRSTPKTGRAQLTGRLVIQRGANHVVVSGLKLDGRAVNGPGADDLPSPTVNGNYARFIGNDVTNQRTRVCFVIGSIRGWGRATGTILSGNRIHNCGKRPGNNHHHGIYVEGATGTKIVHNVIYQNADRGIQLYPDAQRTQIIGNVIDGNGQGIIFSGAEGYTSNRNRVLRNVITNSRTRSNVEHWWENPAWPGIGNTVLRNCVGSAKQGPYALPIRGYTLRGNTRANPIYRKRFAGDFRLKNGRGACGAWMRSVSLPLAPR